MVQVIDITVSTISICKTLAISLPSPVEMPILIRLLSPSAANTLAVTAKRTPIIVLNATHTLASAFLCFLIKCNILYIRLTFWLVFLEFL